MRTESWTGWADGWTLRSRLIASFALVMLMTAVLGGSALLALKVVNQSSSDLAHKWLPSVRALGEARTSMLSFRELEVKHTRTDDSSYHAEYEDKMSQAAQQVSRALDQYRGHPLKDAERPLMEKVDQSWKAYLAQTAKIVAMGRNQEHDDARDVSDGAGKNLFDTSLRNLDLAARHVFDEGKASAEASDQTFSLAQKVLLGLLALTVLVGATLALLLTRSVIRQLGGEPRDALELVKAVANGNLNSHIPVRPGDTRSLMANLQLMQSALARLVTSVRQTSESVATASAEIATGNSDLSQRTEMQASALQQTAASMEELGSTVQQNADNARQANQLAQSASSVAQQGGAVVHQVVESMRVIHESSKRIADITSVIDGIAFQTNILALNAAVEAARAGEQGRGFAVVAAEVRSLAQRSATAAKEIKDLIAQSADQVQQGSEQVDKAGATMTDVVQAIRRVTDIVGEITAASEQQSQGVHQVGEAITQMDQGTQQNAALVEQSAAAAESLRHQAQQLVESVAVFRTH